MKRTVRAVVFCLVLGLGATSAQAATRAAPDGVAAGASTFGGYLFVSNQVGKVSSSWAQPAVNCSGEDTFASFSVGLGDATHHLAARVGVVAACRDGLPVYFGWLKIPGAPAQHLGRKVAAGDVISVDLDSGGGPLSAELDNVTRGWGVGVSTEDELKSTDAGAGVSERADGSTGLSDFGAVSFTDVRLDGKPVGDQTVLRISMQTAGGVVQAKPSKLTRRGDFTVTWLHQARERDNRAPS